MNIVAKGKYFDKVTLAAFYHDFESVEGGTDLGDEWDFVAAYKYDENWSALAKYADYNQGEDPTYTDTQRFSIQIDYKY